eukprot:1545080-Amphidinium_carterae.1
MLPKIPRRLDCIKYVAPLYILGLVGLVASRRTLLGAADEFKIDWNLISSEGAFGCFATACAAKTSLFSKAKKAALTDETFRPLTLHLTTVNVRVPSAAHRKKMVTALLLVSKQPWITSWRKTQPTLPRFRGAAPPDVLHSRFRLDVFICADLSFSLMGKSALMQCFDGNHQ